MRFLKFGPAGGPFDDIEPISTGDADKQNISTIQVFTGETIDRIIVKYMLGTSSFSIQHGESGGGGANPVFVTDGEPITAVEGYVGIFDTTVEIKGLLFRTPRKVSAFFGHQTAAPFLFQAPPNGEIFAFFGRKGLFLDALGVHVRLP
jgi:hypothetical protein